MIRGFNNMINKIHECALRIVYRDDHSTFEDLLKKDNSLTIHHRNIHTMAIEMFKSLNGIGPELLNNIFIKKDSTNTRTLRSHNDFFIPQVNTVHYGHDSLRYFGSKIWGIIPNKIKSCETLIEFKVKIKKWVPSDCPCRLCKDYVHGVGYI